MIIVNSVKSLAVTLQEQKVLKEIQSFSFAAKMTCKKLCNEWRLFQTFYFLSWLDRKLLIIMNKLADRRTPTRLLSKHISDAHRLKFHGKGLWGVCKFLEGVMGL